MARGRKAKAGKKRSGATVAWSEAELKNFVQKEGTYLFKTTEAELSDDEENLIINAEVISEGSQEGKTVKMYFNLGAKALWKLAQFMEAVGMDIPEDDADLDPDEFKELEFVGEVEEHEYNDNTYMRVQRFYPAEEFEGNEKKGSGKKEEKGSSKKASKKEEPEDEETEKFARADIEGMNRKKLEKFITTNELDVDPDDHKKDAKLLKAILDELEEKDMLEEAEEEEPAKSGKRDRKAAKNKKKGGDDNELPKVSKDEIGDMNEEELDDLVDKYELEVDLSEAKTLRKKGALVIAALEDKELLED